jgi:hypothetical protein
MDVAGVVPSKGVRRSPINPVSVATLVPIVVVRIVVALGSSQTVIAMVVRTVARRMDHRALVVAMGPEKDAGSVRRAADPSASTK